MPSLPSKIKTFAISIKNLKLKLYKEANLFQVLGCLRKNSNRRGGEGGH